MIRNNHIKKYEKRDPYKEVEEKLLKDDEEYIIKSYRPISGTKIKEIQLSKVNEFVDDILGDMTISKVLFSSNAKKEINILKKGNDFMKKNQIKSNYNSTKENPANIFIKRKKNETIGKMRIETDKFKEERLNCHANLIENNLKFYQSIITERKAKENEYLLSLNANRCKRFEEIFKNIKEKLENYYNHNHKRYKVISTEHAIKVTDIELPEVLLNMQDVYSRLFYNAVYIPPRKTVIIKGFQDYKRNEENKANQQKITNFTVRNAISSSNGKEFTVKITNEIHDQCFYKYSGGPPLKKEKIFPAIKPNTYHPQDFVKNTDSSDIKTTLSSYETVKTVFKEGTIQVNLLEMRDKENGNTFLHNSVADELLELANYLCIKGVEINAQNFNGDTPLHLAIKSANKQVITYV